MLALSMRDSRRQQKTGLLRLEFGRVTDNKTLLFTEEIHNVDTLKKQGVYTARLSRQ